MARLAARRATQSPETRSLFNSANAAQVAADIERNGRESKMKEAIQMVFRHEGSGYVSKDGGRESSRFGILQGTAERYGYQGSVKNMSRAQAEIIYEKIWAESGAEELPRSLALVHFDTYMNSPAAAKKILKASGGDVDTYIQMRSQRYGRLAKARPELYARYLKGWMNRINNLRNMVAQNGMPQTDKAST
jgi:lysozyme family protein